MAKPPYRVWALGALVVAALVLAAVGTIQPPAPPAAGPSHALDASVAQPALKRNIYVFLDRFTDRTNTTTPAEITAKLDAVGAYFSDVSHGAWTFNWTLFYPSLGQPWYTVNETYAEAGASSNLTPLAEVIMAAYNDGARFPAPGTYPLVPSALIIHAGDDGAMTGNTTDIWSVTTGPYCSGFATNPPNAFCLLTSIVAETDPVGIIAHELTHELQRFDEFGNPMGITLGHSNGALPSGMVPVDWWDLMYQGLRNPINDAAIPKGEEPAELMAWNRMSVGLLPLSQIAVVGKGQSATVALQDLEEPTMGYQAIRIPIVNTSAYRTYYFVELRKGVSYDYYFPWLTSLYPDRIGMLVYWVNVSAYGEPFQIFLEKAHPTDVNAQQALFGPCASPCVPAMSFVDAVHGVNLTIASTSNSSFTVQVSNAVTPASPLEGPPTTSPPPSSNATQTPAAPTCPSSGCFLGVVNLGSWGMALTAAVILALGASLVGLAIIVRRERRTRREIERRSRQRA